MEDYVGLSTTSVNNLLKVITRQRTCWDLKPRPLSYWSETLPLATGLLVPYVMLSGHLEEVMLVPLFSM